MNLSDTVDSIVKARLEGSQPSERVAEFLRASVASSRAMIETERSASVAQADLLVALVTLLFAALFVFSVWKRRHRTAGLAALIVSVTLFLETSLGAHVLSWPVQNNCESLFVQFPVQHASQMLIVGTHYDAWTADNDADGRFGQAVEAFVGPMTVALLIMGLWQFCLHFGYLKFEDAHTIMFTMGMGCLLLYGAWTFFCWQRLSRQTVSDPYHNAGSIAVLTGLVEDLSRRYRNVQNTSVTVAFFGGGSDAAAARAYARRLAREDKRAVPVYFLACEHIGRGGDHALLIPFESADPLFRDRALVRILDRVAGSVTRKQLGMLTANPSNARGFVEQGFPTATLTTLPKETSKTPEDKESEQIARGGLLVSLKLLEQFVFEFDRASAPRVSAP